MRILSTLFVLIIFLLKAQSQPPKNDNIQNATKLALIQGYCSGEGEFNNKNATPSGYQKGSFWMSQGNDIWYVFTAIATDISITASGKGTGPATLVNPTIAIYTFSNNILTEQIGSMQSSNNITTAYKGGLIIGEQYFVRISAENDVTGSFKLCVNNYNPPQKPGQDFASASQLCSKDAFTEIKVTGAGTYNREALGTCLTTESNTAWYSWIAADNGTLTFIITPTSSSDDIDWVLFDLGPETNNATPSASNAIRCAAGNGVSCTPRYFLTGIDETSSDINEQANCLVGQDGFVKVVTMTTGHRYAIIIDNFSNENNGFTISFGGSGNFVGPMAKINVTTENPCLESQSFNFSATASGYSKLNWAFGTDAIPQTAEGQGPFKVNYSSLGTKTVTLTATTKRDCKAITSASIEVGIPPPLPEIIMNRQRYCLGDVLILSTPEQIGVEYLWTGPAGFFSKEREIMLLLNSKEQAGKYYLTVKNGNCTSGVALVEIPKLLSAVRAYFTTEPSLSGKFGAPATLFFVNLSEHAEQFEWDFGDGTQSSEKNPQHTYQKAGKYSIKLNAFNANKCSNTFTLGEVVVLDENTLDIPNSFSPNGDGINDKFNVNLINLKSYSIEIFNRNGDKVFESASIFDSWDGNWHSQPVTPGAYFYVISTTDLIGKFNRKSGSITLLR